MAQVSIGQVENLEDLVRGLLSVLEALKSSCREQIAAAEQKCEEAREEIQNSESMLESAIQQEQSAKREIDSVQQALDSSQSMLSSAQSSLSDCLAQPTDEDGTSSDCSGEYSSVAEEETAVEQAQSMLEQAKADFNLATENRQAMEQRVDLARQAQTMAKHTLVQAQQECNIRLASVDQAIEVGTARLAAAQQALNAYLATNSTAAEFHAWLKWNPAQNGRPITPDTLRDRMNLSSEQRRLFQEYLYDRNPAYRRQVNKYG